MNIKMSSMGEQKPLCAKEKQRPIASTHAQREEQASEQCKPTSAHGQGSSLLKRTLQMSPQVVCFHILRTLSGQRTVRRRDSHPSRLAPPTPPRRWQGSTSREGSEVAKVQGRHCLGPTAEGLGRDCPAITK